MPQALAIVAGFYHNIHGRYNSIFVLSICLVSSNIGSIFILAV